MNPWGYPSDAVNKNYDIVSEGEYTAGCLINSKLPAFNLTNKYEPKYVDTTIDFTKDSMDYITIMGRGKLRP